MQVKDPNFSARLREYLGVAKTTSAEFQECQVPIIKERRRFTDVMEEESTTQRESRLSAWGRDDFSVYKMHTAQTVEIQVTFLICTTFNTDLFVMPSLSEVISWLCNA